LDVRLVIRQRLKELELEQRDLAAAAQVTESYVSQLLTLKKAPPAVDRTDLYGRMNSFLKFPTGHLASLALAQRREELERELADPPAPLFNEVRDLVIRKCKIERRGQVKEIFEKQAFGELERLVSQTLLDVAKGIARDELDNEVWFNGAVKVHRRPYEEMRAMTLAFLDTDVFNVTKEHCSVFLDPMIDSWDIELKTFAVDVILNKRLASARRMRFQFRQTEGELSLEEQPGFREFLRNQEMSGDATAEELDFLKSLQFKHGSPSPLYYYREMQSIRDPLHFSASAAKTANGDAIGAGDAPDQAVRKKTIRK
jgi:transcriptional regulator with XRE-family HTH domain